MNLYNYFHFSVGNLTWLYSTYSYIQYLNDLLYNIYIYFFGFSTESHFLSWSLIRHELKSQRFAQIVLPLFLENALGNTNNCVKLDDLGDGVIHRKWSTVENIRLLIRYN